MSQGYSAPPPPAYPQAQPSSGLAIASMILGIVSCVTFCIWWLSLVCGVVAVVLGFVARSKIAAGTGGGKGMATTGIICGIIGPLLAILVIVLVIAGFAVFMNNPAVKKAIEDGMQQQQQQGGPGAGQGAMLEAMSYYARALV